MFFLAGCARYPSTPVGPAPTRQLMVEIRVAGVINPNYYYFLAMDPDDAPEDGPVPIVSGPEWGNGWGVISGTGQPPPNYARYHANIYRQFRYIGYEQDQGPCFQGWISADGKSLHITIDLDLVTVVANYLDINFINTDSLVPPPPDQGLFKIYDALGPTGNDFITIPINVNGIYTNSQAAIRELEGDCELPDIDIIDWTIEIKLT